MGEQFLDLFAAGAYALTGRLMLGLGGDDMAWLFYLLAGAGLLYAIAQSALGHAPTLWARQLVATALASILIMLPAKIDLAGLTYAAPGRVEAIFGSRIGAAPHLTYAIERLGAAVAVRIRGIAGAQPALAVPGVVGQVADLVADPALLDDAQLRANLEIWRRRIVPQLLLDDPALDARLRSAGLTGLLLNPTVDDARFIAARTLARVQQLHAQLAATSSALGTIVYVQDSSLRKITDAAGADPWLAPDPNGSASIRFVQGSPATAPTVTTTTGSGPYSAALQRGAALAEDMVALQSDAYQATDVASVDDLYRRLATSTLVVAGNAYLRAPDRLATLGSLCQRAGDDACRAAQAPLAETSALLHVADKDPYNTPGLMTWLKQSLATILLAIASILLDSLSSLAVAVLPFMLGVAKVIAILLSVVGVWMLLWPGRMAAAMTWIVGPIAFVSLWSVLFDIWAEVEGFLSSLASVVGNSDHGSWSAGRIMSIALSLGYLGLPTLALHILFGTAHGAIEHGGRQLETALQTGIRHAPGIVAFGRRWLWRAPLVQRFNRRIYSKVGLGVLATRRRTPARAAPRAKPAAASATPPSAAPPTESAVSPEASAAPPPAPRRPRPRTTKADTGDAPAPPAKKPPRPRKKPDPPA